VTTAFIGYFHIVVLRIPSVVLQYLGTDRNGAFLICPLRKCQKRNMD